MPELGLIATFPVLPEAKAWLRDEGPPLERLLSDIAYNRARDRARTHVWDALEGTPPDPRVPASPVEAEMAVLARPLARLIVAAVGEDHLASRFAVWEAKRTARALERAPLQLVLAVADALGVHVVEDPGQDDANVLAMSVTDFLLCAPNEKAWHLVRRDPQQGRVRLVQEDFARLLEEVYRRRLEMDLEGRRGQVPAVVREVFKGDVADLQEAVKRRLEQHRRDRLTEVTPGLFPPCMKRIQADMHAHRNIPHMGRFAIVTFLHHLEMDTEKILSFFSSVPDFDPEKSRYQIEHITGKGSPDAYTPPGCATMQSYGVCPLEERDSLCMRIKHPLSYYRKALWRDKKRKEEAAHATGPGGGDDHGGPPSHEEGEVPAKREVSQ